MDSEVNRHLNSVSSCTVCTSTHDDLQSVRMPALSVQPYFLNNKFVVLTHGTDVTCISIQVRKAPTVQCNPNKFNA